MKQPKSRLKNIFMAYECKRFDLNTFVFSLFMYLTTPSYRRLADGYSKRTNFDSVRHHLHNEGSDNAPAQSATIHFILTFPKEEIMKAV